MVEPEPLNHVFELYIAGSARRSRRAIACIEDLGAGILKGHFQLEVIDIIEHPDRAEGANILATPTLIRTAPAPSRRIIGDLSDAEALLAALDL